MLSTKVEIRLAKAEQITWTSLDYDKKPKAVPQKITPPGNKLSKTIAVDFQKTVEPTIVLLLVVS